MEVAADEFLQRGYGATSLERIADAAGYSKGAVYSNFAGKEELVLAVLDAHFVHRLDRLQEMLLAAPETVAGRLDAFAGWWAGMVGEQRWGVLILEIATASRDRPHFQAQFAQREQQIMAFVTMMIETETARFDLDLPFTPHDLASILVTLGSGLSFSRMLDPTISTDILTDLAHVLFAGSDRPAP